MRLEINRYSMNIVPETPQDEAYLEEVLDLRCGEDRCIAERHNAMGLSCWAYLRIEKADE